MLSLFFVRERVVDVARISYTFVIQMDDKCDSGWRGS